MISINKYVKQKHIKLKFDQLVPGVIFSQGKSASNFYIVDEVKGTYVRAYPANSVKHKTCYNFYNSYNSYYYRGFKS